MRRTGSIDDAIRPVGGAARILCLHPARSPGLLACLCIGLLSIGAVAQPPLQLADYLEWENAADPRISPDGGQVVYTRSRVNKLEDRQDSELWIVATNGEKHRFSTRGSNARWSSDGTRIAYIADGEPAGAQIFVRWADAEGATSQLTRLTEAPTNLHWSPDGDRIAFTMPVEQDDSWSIELPKAPEGASWTKEPRIVEHSHYRMDRRGFLSTANIHLFVVSATGGTPRELTRGNWNVGARPSGLPYAAGFSWTPDGKEIVFDGNRDGDADRSYRESHIHAVDVASGAIRQVTSEKGPWTSPVVSPDGRRVAYIGFPWTPQTYKTNSIYVSNLDGTAVHQISDGLDRDPTTLMWDSDSRGVFFNVDSEGSRNLHYAAVRGGTKAITSGVQMLTATTMSDKGRFAGVLTSPHSPPEVVTFSASRPDALRRLTDLHSDILSQRSLGAVEQIWYESTGGTRVQGWIVFPPDFNAAKQYPLILHIHGGPHGMYNVGFNFSFQHLAAEGYIVLYTNPRGSTGYGTDFGNAIDNAYPSVDYDDLMAGVDALVARGYVDGKRLYATGVSGGGVLSSWIVGHTDRFAAAAVRAPVINWISFAGTTDITSWGWYRFRPPFWDDPDLWLRHSPIMYVQNVTTPTLLMTGELDLRTPMGQSEEYYQALRKLGVPTALIRFNEEYHGTGSKPSNFMRTQLYLLEWFGRYPGEE